MNHSGLLNLQIFLHEHELQKTQGTTELNPHSDFVPNSRFEQNAEAHTRHSFQLPTLTYQSHSKSEMKRVECSEEKEVVLQRCLLK